MDCVLTKAPLDVATSSDAAPESNVSSTGYSYTVKEYVAYIMKDLDEQWSKWFIEVGFEEPFVYYRFIEPGQTFTSTCATNGVQVYAADHNNAFYCPTDEHVDTQGTTYRGSIVLPALTLQKMWTGNIFNRPSNRIGDFGAAIIMAHEFGHHVQDEIAVQAAGVGRLLPPPQGKNKELIADCFAGVWTASAYYTGLLEAGDFEEAVAALAAIGDQAPGGLDPHGTGPERVVAMKAGYNGARGYAPGDPLSCIATYWY